MPAPVTNPVITCEFGTPGSWKAGYHTGRDYRAAIGTPVRATRSGRVISVGPAGDYGKLVVIKSGGIEHRYAHLSSFATHDGDEVEAGELIGHSGDTGNTRGAHLHYEERINPFGYFDHRKPLFDAHAPGPVVWWRRLALGVHDSDSVRHLQRRLNRVLEAGLPVTGNYLDETRRAVAAFQRRQGFDGQDADGLIFNPSNGRGGRVTTRRLFPSPPFTIRWDEP